MEFGPQGPLSSPEEVLSRVRTADAKLRTLAGQAKMHVASPSGGGSASAFVSVRQPAFFYLEVQDFFGKPQASLTSDGQRFGAYQADEGRYYTGPATEANVSRLLPMRLSGGEIVQLLRGIVPLLEASPQAFALDERVRGYRMVLEAGGQRQTVWVHPIHFRVLRSELSAVGAAVGENLRTVELDDFLDYGAVVLPKQIQVTSGKAKVEVRYEEDGLVLNGPAEPGLFKVKPPPGIPVLEVDALGNVM